MKAFYISTMILDIEKMKSWGNLKAW